MNTQRGAWMIGLLVLCAAIASAASIKTGPGSSIRLEGTSTLHPYFAQTSTFQLEMAVEPPVGESLSAAIEGKAPARMTVTIPVKTLKSEHSGLDKNLQKALRADKNPNIVFTLGSYDVAKGTVAIVVAQGDLTVAGKTEPETIAATLSSKDGQTVIDGQQPLLMTDFGVKPPVLMMGALKTGDRVVVKFHLVLEPAGDAPKGEMK